MKYSVLIFILLGFVQVALAQTQKPVIDTSTPDVWPILGPLSISNDGKYVLYTIHNVPTGSCTLAMRSTFNFWYQEFPNVEEGAFTADSRRVVFKTRDGCLGIQQLGGDVVQYISDVPEYRLASEGMGRWMAYLVKKDQGRVGELVLHDWQTNWDKRDSNVTNFALSPRGDALIYTTLKSRRDFTSEYLHWMNSADGEIRDIGNGEKFSQLTFDPAGTRAAFLERRQYMDRVGYCIDSYKAGAAGFTHWLFDGSRGIEAGRVIGVHPRSSIGFSPDGTRLFFSLFAETPALPDPDAVQVDVYRSGDRYLPSKQRDLLEQKFYDAAVRVDDSVAIPLEHAYENMTQDGQYRKENYSLMIRHNSDELWQRRDFLPQVYLVCTKNGSRQLLKDSITSFTWVDNTVGSSPGDSWYIWFDPDKRAWISLEQSTGNRRNITSQIPVSMTNENTADQGSSGKNAPAGAGVWLADESAVFLYDDYDIWQVDPAGKAAPVNLTRGLGRKLGLKFRIIASESDRKIGVDGSARLLLTAFAPETKQNGFYRLELGSGNEPQLLYMDDALFHITGTQVGLYNFRNSFAPVKARDANVWVVQKMCVDTFPNYYLTRDFVNFQPLTRLHPEKAWNWLTAELLRWTLPDGRRTQGILYKPENFNANHKYPLIVCLYERSSDELHLYRAPALTNSQINIPWFVSRGYLVLLPDICYRPGYPGASALETVESAIKSLSHNPWLNKQKLGITGHSFGAFETLYIITHSHLFAAAAEACGVSNMISSYGGLREGGGSAQPFYESEQGRIGATLWQRPDLYQENSPIFQLHTVTTPLLMMHNTGDPVVPFQQGVECFTGLRRLNKRVWMLQYDEPNHYLKSLDNQLDYTIRLAQFFDYYLKDALPPVWMTQGIPARQKGFFTGYQPDTSNRKP